MQRSVFFVLALGCGAALAACHQPNLPASGPAAGPSPRGVGTKAIAPRPSMKRLDGSRDGSNILVAELEGHTVAYVADEDDGVVRVVDVDDNREISSAHVGGIPAQLVMLADGRLIASLRDVSQIVVLDGGGSATSKLRVEQRVDVPTEPMGLALSHDDKTLVVASGWGRRVTVLDVATMTKKAEHVVTREPRSIVVAKDGTRAFVSHVVGNTLDVIPLESVGPPIALHVSGREELIGRHSMVSEQSRAACQGFALARAESGRVFAPHVLVFTGDPSEASSGYGGGEGREAEVFNVPVVDEDAARVIATSTKLRAGIEGTARCALPRAAKAGKAGLFVTCLGDDTVELLDASAANPHDVEIARWSVPSGPVGVALDEPHARAVVWSQFAHAVTTIAIGEGENVPKPLALASVSVARETRASAKIERGRELFHATKDTRISSDGRACASCHPDGRDDTLVWSSPNGPRQTPILAGRLDGAAPYGWNGDAKDVSSHLTSTFKRLGGKGITGDDKEALMAYVQSMRSPPSTAPRDAKTRDAALRGLAIFRSAETECATCHGAGGDLPDGSQHDVKSRAEGDLRVKFDTPSLRFVGSSGPYFHDGRYADLPTLLVKSDGKMGHTKQLSKDQIADLTAYLESL